MTLVKCYSILGVAQGVSAEDVQKATSEKWSFGVMDGLAFGEIVTIIATFVFFGIGGVLCLALAALWIVLFVRSHRAPRWKWSWKQSPAYVRQTGLQ